MALYFSMSNAFIGRPSHFIGLRNFINLWDSDAFRQTFQNAFVFTGIAVAVQGRAGHHRWPCCSTSSSGSSG